MNNSNKPQPDKAGQASPVFRQIGGIREQEEDVSMKECIKNRVHELYWNDDINCARTAIICLGELFETAIEQQTLWSAVGLHGAGGYRAQCGLVEGALMFIGIYLHVMGKTEDEIVSACYNFASAFEKTFGSLRCFELRPTGFSENDPPHMCENLTCKGIEFAYQYILKVKKSIPNKVTAGQGRAGIPGFPADWEIGEQREDVKVGMELYSLQELLKQYLDWGFDFASISIATQIPEELRQLYSNENYRLRDKDKEKYLMVFLLQICCEKPDNDEYYKALLESLTQYFKIPLEAMANYIGVDIDELLDFGSSSDKDRIEKCIAHLFTTFIRDSSYSV